MIFSHEEVIPTTSAQRSVLLIVAARERSPPDDVFVVCSPFIRYFLLEEIQKVSGKLHRPLHKTNHPGM